MKISKIFHSLYAFLMFLPVCAVLGTTLYSILNPNAKDSYSGSTEFTTQELVYQYETDTPFINQEDGSWSMTTGHAYTLRFYYDDIITMNNSQSFDVFNDFGTNCLILGYDFYNNPVTVNFFIESFDYVSVMYNNEPSDTLTIDFDNAEDDLTTSYIFSTFLNNIDIYFVFNGDLIFNLVYFDFLPCPLDKIPYTVETITHESETLDNAFSYSVNSLYSNPLFSWCNNSFLSEPFHYIGDLFGLPRDNAINTLFSYWLNISIIWLCFDVIMYVPLLCHRWIDKGGLE